MPKYLSKAILFFGIIASINTPINLTYAYQKQQLQHSLNLTEVVQLNHQEQVQAVTTIGMTVDDMDRAIQFYTDVLTFRKISDLEVWGDNYEHLQGLFGVRMRIVKMQLGQEIIELTEYLTPKGRPIPVDSRSNDLWFQHIAIVVSDMNQAYQHLRKFNVQHVSTAPQRLPEYITAAAGIEAFYFQDPDGHNLEIIHFPKGKGNSRWQNPTSQLFLGIDHTAIAVSNTAKSLQFYRDLLGLEVIGTSENYGTEQAHLNQVPDAHLQISGLKAKTGFGVEFLQYLQPNDARSRPIDSRTNDLITWEITMVVPDLVKVVQKLRANQVEFVSRELVTFPDQLLGFRKGLLVKDPDGHLVRLDAIFN